VAVTHQLAVLAVLAAGLAVLDSQPAAAAAAAAAVLCAVDTVSCSAE